MFFWMLQSYRFAGANSPRTGVNLNEGPDGEFVVVGGSSFLSAGDASRPWSSTYFESSQKNINAGFDSLKPRRLPWERSSVPVGTTLQLLLSNHNKSSWLGSNSNLHCMSQDSMGSPFEDTETRAKF